jgi:ribosomal protein S27AE
MFKKVEKGHWFCSRCDDIVFMSYRWRAEADVACPVCGYPACNFIPEKFSRRRIASGWFDAMRRKIEDPR